LATGIFNAGTNIGAVVTLMVPWVTRIYGWRAAFLATGASGFLWLIAWSAIYRLPDQHPAVSRPELAYIRSDPSGSVSGIPWMKLIALLQTWAFAIGKFLTDPIWWLFLFWLPDFLFNRHGMTLLNVGLPLMAIYQMATIGSIGGGWLSSILINRGWSINAGTIRAYQRCIKETPIDARQQRCRATLHRRNH
jgi:MFS transporter, ACS family, hexuronate transporter